MGLGGRLGIALPGIPDACRRQSAVVPALERQARTGSARRATVRSAEPEPGADEPGHDCRLIGRLGIAYSRLSFRLDQRGGERWVR
jgi:hypothetical protein